MGRRSLEQKDLHAEFMDSFKRKTALLADHLWLCMVTGVSVPLVRMFWDEEKGDLEVEIYGPGRLIKRRKRR